MTMTASRDQDEALIAAARSSLQEVRARSERVCYYRCPQVTTDGAQHKQPGWIIWGDTQQGVKLNNIARGYIPLDSLGYIRAKRRDDDDDGPFERHGVWGPLLCQREGVLALPAGQILAYHWYDANRLRQSMGGVIPPTLKTALDAHGSEMVLWPQLQGKELNIFACPECTDWRTLEAAHLARHVRIWHDFDRADIIAFGQQYGVDFSSELNREGRVIRSFTFDQPTEEPDEEPESVGFSIEVARPKLGRPRKETI